MDIIERYLNNEMGDAERADFERRLANDPELAAQLAWQQKVIAALRDREAQAFRERLGRVRAERAQAAPKPLSPQSPVSGSRWRWLGVVLPAVLALGAYLAYRAMQEQPSSPPPPIETPAAPIAQNLPAENTLMAPEKQTAPSHPDPRYATLALQYYQSPADLLPSGRRTGADSSGLNLMQRSKQQYAEACRIQKQNPALAARLFKSVADTLARPPEEIKIMAAYLRGHAHFNLKAYREAARDFDAVARDGKKDALPARWFQALALLAMDTPSQQVAPLLTAVSAQPNQYQQQAKALLLKIQSR